MKPNHKIAVYHCQEIHITERKAGDGRALICGLYSAEDITGKYSNYRYRSGHSQSPESSSLMMTYQHSHFSGLKNGLCIG